MYESRNIYFLVILFLYVFSKHIKKTFIYILKAKQLIEDTKFQYKRIFFI